MARWLTVTGGVLAVGVSAALLASLIVRPAADVNWLAGYTLAMTALAGIAAVYGCGQIGWGLAALTLLVVGLLPVVSWISFLYWPSVVLVILGVALRLSHRSGDRGRNDVRRTHP